jgi:hypothetical protein
VFGDPVRKLWTLNTLRCDEGSVSRLGADGVEEAVFAGGQFDERMYVF